MALAAEEPENPRRTRPFLAMLLPRFWLKARAFFWHALASLAKIIGPGFTGHQKNDSAQHAPAPEQNY